MKKSIITFMLFWLANIAFSQITVTIKPNASIGKDAWIISDHATTNYGTSPNYAALAWSGFLSRSLLNFDMSGIPSNATISSAKLNLYCNTTSDHTQLHSSFSGSNEGLLQRITSTWDENTVTWNNQPTTSTSNQVSLAQSTSQTQDYLNIDVANLINDTRANPSTSFGIMIKLVTEQQYRSLVFASSDHADSARWPKLVITYTPAAPSAAINIITPNGGEILQANNNYNITWQSTLVDSVSIFYSTNGGTNWSAVTGLIPSTGTLTWSIPNINSTQCKIKIVSKDQTITAISSSVFTVNNPLQPTVMVLNPNGADSLKANTNYSITWQSNNVDSVLLYYTANGGATWNVIGAGLMPSTGTYTWLVPSLNSTQCKIRVIAKNQTAIDESNGVFTIYIPVPKTSIKLLTPNGGDNLVIGTNYNITWQSTNIDSVIISFSINNGASWIPINTVLSTGVFTWTVPNIQCTQALVKISDKNAIAFDNSDAVFSISMSSGINEVARKISFELQPNPTNNYAVIRINENLKNKNCYLNLIGINGQLELSKTIFDKDFILDVNELNLAKGIHFIQLSIDGNVAYKKLVVY